MKLPYSRYTLKLEVEPTSVTSFFLLALRARLGCVNHTN